MMRPIPKTWRYVTSLEEIREGTHYVASSGNEYVVTYRRLYLFGLTVDLSPVDTENGCKPFRTTIEETPFSLRGFLPSVAEVRA